MDEILGVQAMEIEELSRTEDEELTDLQTSQNHIEFFLSGYPR